MLPRATPEDIAFTLANLSGHSREEIKRATPEEIQSVFDNSSALLCYRTARACCLTGFIKPTLTDNGGLVWFLLSYNGEGTVSELRKAPKISQAFSEEVKWLKAHVTTPVTQKFARWVGMKPVGDDWFVWER